jgi:hypothetical protein
MLIFVNVLDEAVKNIAAIFVFFRSKYSIADFLAQQFKNILLKTYQGSWADLAN